MSANNDGSGKGSGKTSGDANSPKKPSPLIDLKATEIKPAASTAAASPAASPADYIKTTVASEKSPPASVEIKPSAASTSAVPPVAKPADKSQATKPATAAAQTQPNTARPSTPSQPNTAKPTRSDGGIAAVASHLFAGIAGGFLALLGADSIAPQLGLAGTGSNLTEMQRRLAIVEEAAKSKTAAASPEVTQKLAATEARLAKMEELGRALPGLAESQAKLAADAKLLSERVAKPAPGADAEKLARLEDTLTALAAAASADPQKGRIPQLAQITGKIADLEASLNGQMASVRKTVTQDVDSRLGQATEAAEQARAGVQRIDRDLSAVKTDAARTGQRLETIDQTLKLTKDETATLKATVTGLKSDLDSQLKSVARPQDVSSALAPLNTKLASVEQNLASVVKSEDDRRANAERIVLSLELANLKRALDRGGAFVAELAAVQKASGGKIDLKALDAVKDKGVATTTALATEFRTAAYAIIAADAEPADGSVVEKLIAGAKSIVRIRKSSAEAADNSAEAIAARMDASLKANRLADVVEEAKKLSPKARKAGAIWLANVEARAVVDRTVADIETQLKAALGGKPTP